MLIAHRSEDGRTQSFFEHATAAADLAARFAAKFGDERPAYAGGLLHDAGKCSPAGQARLMGGGAAVEHSAAGAEILGGDPRNNPYGYLLAYCIAGHHSGLPDGGVSTDTEDRPTLIAKLKRQKARNRDYAAYADALGSPPPADISFSLALPQKDAAFSLAFRTRMLYSCLVDADFLDTAAFMSNTPLREGIGEPLALLFKRLRRRLASFGPPKDIVGEKRAEVQRDCLLAAESPRGLFSLTVPTGGGKTLSSLAFALLHALKNGLDRVVYVIPYTSIIDQTAKIFREALGEQNVLEHHHNVNYDTPDGGEGDPRALAAENWDAPIIVTTNVQFFESLFSNRPSRCRKLHNIANSVIIFDEAQMFPVDLLLPCIRAIEQLVQNHRCTAVLCSATQPALGPYLAPALRPREICADPQSLYVSLARVHYEQLGQVSDDALLARLNSHEQALCVVNTKLQAQALYAGLSGRGCYHLSTLMTPAHRRRVLDKIRVRLKHGLPCRVVSTSLIEVGVDVDFPVVYREEAGLDSVIQAAGRCNREGRLSAGDAPVYVFRPDDVYQKKRPRPLQLPIAVARLIMESHADISSQQAIQDYFLQYFNFRGASLDQKEILRQIANGVSAGLSIPFASIAEQFRVIDAPTRTVLIPENDEARGIIAALKSGAHSRGLLRKAGLHAVSVYPQQYELLLGAGLLVVLDSELSALRDMSSYSKDVGLQIPKGGIGIIA